MSSVGSSSNSGSIMQQLSSIPNVSGSGVPVQQYTTAMQQALTQEMTAVPDEQIQTFAATTSALSSLQSALQQLQTATQTLASAQTWTPTSVTSSNTSSFTLAGGPGAIVSSFGINVTSLAQAQMDVTQFTGTASVTGGTFSIQGAGTSAVQITVTSGESLSDIVSSVNSQTTNTDVQAFLLGNNQIAFQSTLTGQSNGFTLADVSGNFVTGQAFVTMTQSASDATITIGGTTVTSSSDVFSNIVPNVTLTAVATGSGELSVTQNTSQVMTSVQSWMTAYNSVINLLNTDTAYTPPIAGSTGSGQAGPLVGDPTASGLLSQLPNSITSMLPSNGVLQSLSAVGIVVDPNNGNLEFQSSSGFTINGQSFGGTLQSGQTMFQNALNNNLGQLQSLFGVVPDTTLQTVIPMSGVLGSLNNNLNQYLGFGSMKGMIPTELKSISDQTTNLNNYLTEVNQMITSRVSNFTSQLNTLNASLQKTQSQMSMLSSLFGSNSSSNSSGSSGSSSSSSSSGL
ncbi:MAG: flagellar filament capping protein FliD [Acidibacillus sp.]|nr:flagellar filament capping protein FliD [Acidibacillus sp.]